MTGGEGTAHAAVQQLTPNQSSTTATLPQYSVPAAQVFGGSKYNQLLNIIEELGKDIRPTYTGNKLSSERLKRNIIHARILVRECMQSSIVLHERPAALQIIDKQSLELLVTTYQLHDENSRYSGSIYKLIGCKIIKKLAVPAGIFRFDRHPNSPTITAALTNGSVGIVSCDLNSLNTLPVISNGMLLSISMAAQGDGAVCSDTHGQLHVVCISSAVPAGIFRFDRHPNSPTVTAALTNGSVGIVSCDLNSLNTLAVISNGMLLSISMAAQGDRAVCSDTHGQLHVVCISSGRK
ncbi:unnamed protein product [Gongylonema pulchrum]|uniref:Nucleoporin_N domain-containing protein n=1 Tax=Gongylonema pulchrum TaxID=637853 RepID=A0A183EIV9_9BILA|nr:unnamed protein product [Gongylonema pulchrum]